MNARAASVWELIAAAHECNSPVPIAAVRRAAVTALGVDGASVAARLGRGERQARGTPVHQPGDWGSAQLPGAGSGAWASRPAAALAGRSEVTPPRPSPDVQAGDGKDCEDNDQAGEHGALLRVTGSQAATGKPLTRVLSPAYGRTRKLAICFHYHEPCAPGTWPLLARHARVLPAIAAQRRGTSGLTDRAARLPGVRVPTPLADPRPRLGSRRGPASGAG